MAKTILSVDGGLANLGWAVFSFGDGQINLVSNGVIQTSKGDKKKNLSESRDLIHRVSRFYVQAKKIFEKYNPELLFIESFSFPRSSSAAAKYAMGFSSILSIAVSRNIPVFEASPKDVKYKMTGKKTASKQEMIDIVEKEFKPNWQKLSTEKKTEKVKEHQADAIGVALTCLDDPVVRLILGSIHGK